MINAIQLLRNIGQFDSVDAAAGIPLARLTVIYAENGRGKTTLVAVLRSLATGDPLPIAERQRLGAEHPPHIVLGCSGGPRPAVFQDNAWDLVIYDDVFVDENVHSGLAVHPSHRQNLHEFILGAQAVTLSRQFQQLVEEIEAHNRELRARAGAIPAADRGPFTVDEFCALPQRPGVDEAIEETERALAAAEEQDAIRTTASFESLGLPAIDLAAIGEVLQQDLPALDAATLARVQEHLARLGQGGEGWVSDGMHYILQDADETDGATCPFCAQDLQSSPVIHHYRAYFSDAYAGLKRAVRDAAGEIDRTHGGDLPAAFERAVRIVVERRQFWSRFCDVPAVTLDTAAIVRDWRAAREASVAQLRAKEAAPLDRMQVSDETRAHVATYEEHRDVVSTISERFLEANLAIDVAKERAATADTQIFAQDLARLRAARARHEPGTAVLCEEYVTEREAKRQTEQRRDQTRDMLERHRTRIFPAYQTSINLYLQRFNAGFRLDSVTYVNTRGGQACTYNVLINDTAIPVGGAEPAQGEPSFRNTLSAGDRSTLALALFFASLDQDPDLANKVVVIDDPISSLDEHRSLTTVQEIRRLLERTAQVIVLSHNRPFLGRLWETADATLRTAIEVTRGVAGSTIGEWDVAQDAITEHDRRDANLREFVGSGAGDMREVARSIRPHLEHFLRVACPRDFRPGTLLGPFLNTCRQRLGAPQQILDYANRFHHDTNPAWETEAINDGELRGYVGRALSFAQP